MRHPNICLVNEIHTAATSFGEIDFLTMEFLEGETLGTFAARQARSRRSYGSSHGSFAPAWQKHIGAT